MFRPIKTRKNSEEIVEQIKKLIIEGKLNPGDRLPSERELAEKLEVSRTSIREAFSALEMMGIISIHPGEGSFVNSVSYEGMFQQVSFLMRMDSEGDTMHLYEVRKILEVETAALAAIRATPEDLKMIEDALIEMDEEVKLGGIGDKGDLAFHLALAKAANNPILILLMNTIGDILGNDFKVAREKLFLIDNMPILLNESHKSIYKAVVKKESRLARKKMREHLELVEKSRLLIKKGKVDTEVTKGFLDALDLNPKLIFPT